MRRAAYRQAGESSLISRGIAATLRWRQRADGPLNR